VRSFTTHYHKSGVEKDRIRLSPFTRETHCRANSELVASSVRGRFRFMQFVASFRTSLTGALRRRGGCLEILH